MGMGILKMINKKIATIICRENAFSSPPPLPPLLERVFLAVEQAFHSLSILIKKVIWK